uniref:uncharacterized protein LOC122611098 isoform X2 n=1 Tax=Erigeron canadensis TaxID=72917 RepID=UPI001CB98981|nr:uncharacterized protein LOC122611098 isoform X2 [Erigeron canadensis]
MEILKSNKLPPPLPNSIKSPLVVLLYGSPQSILFISPFPPRSFRVSALKKLPPFFNNTTPTKRTNHLRKKLLVFEQQPPVFYPPPPRIIVDNDVALKPPPPNHTSASTHKSLVLSWSQLQTWALTNRNPFPKQIYVLFVFLVIFSFKTVFTFDKQQQQQHQQHSSSSSLDNQMLSRKIKARKAKQVVVVQQHSNLPPNMDMVKPQLDKQHLMNTIVTANSFNHNSSTDFDNKIQHIRIMARHARDVEKLHANGEDSQTKPMEKEFNRLQPTSVQAAHVPILLNSQDSDDVSRPDVPNIAQNVAQGLEDKASILIGSEKKSRIISSVQEAREYLIKKKLDNKEKTQEPQITNFHQTASNDDMFDFSVNKSSKNTNMGMNGNVLINNTNAKHDKEMPSEGSTSKAGELGRSNREKWMEDNFHEFEPIVEKIRGGFRDNYMLAKEKVESDVKMVSELKMLERDNIESEFEWMKDEKLREIVFQVRENELMGREPFYLMDAEDKALFFKGLEKKVEKENEKLHELHEYVHSNIENLDYGADGISLYDPPEKIIPRWKGPPPATAMSQQSFDDYLDQRKTLFAETLGLSDLVKRDPQDLLQNTNEKAESKNLNSSKTVIEGSDGSIKAGKKSGKEFWLHTKKWSRGFIDSYNAESDPETKAVMKDIGKDLERWITEKEIQDAAAIMNKVPDKGKIFITEKINRLKKEMELFGPQAVVSKYSEYDDEEEIDYYWWLDLPFLLCIELYITGDGDQDGEERIGFYSLEMASDLELDPKPHHIIAFEDAGDCKNLCYIIQSHLEMLGNGNAFVVPQAPKDTYREAKASGFNVTVIRKGELKLDVDQTLEEAEENIVEIGSQMYHDKIMKGRNVDVDSLMKGVFGLTKPNKRLLRPHPV